MTNSLEWYFWEASNCPSFNFSLSLFCILLVIADIKTLGLSYVTACCSVDLTVLASRLKTHQLLSLPILNNDNGWPCRALSIPFVFLSSVPDQEPAPILHEELPAKPSTPPPILLPACPSPSSSLSERHPPPSSYSAATLRSDTPETDDDVGRDTPLPPHLSSAAAAAAALPNTQRDKSAPEIVCLVTVKNHWKTEG